LTPNYATGAILFDHFWQSCSKMSQYTPNDDHFDLRLLAREEATKVILQHLALCPFANLKIEERVRSLETRFAALLGFMVGSGLLGGVAGAGLVKLFGG
jgi:hypothetical protein